MLSCETSNATSHNDLVDAVRGAFVAVEEAVRAAGGYSASDFGEPLMKKAFDPDNGPMGDRDISKPKKEREGLQTLFLGAMNAYRNPISHRTPTLDIEEAKDQLLLASHLLLCVPKTLSKLMTRWNRLNWRNDWAVLFRSGRPDLAIQVEVAA